MRHLPFAAVLFAVLFAAGPSKAADHVPVLVELFTSEGCDSCPPADAVLMRLAEVRQVSGADVIVMSEHVDYWNYLGWKDPFSSRQFTDRQEEYARALGSGNTYTPQMIIDGRYDVLGSNSREVQDTISKAARSEKPTLTAEARANGGSVEVRVTGAMSREPANYYVAITENNLSNQVSRGENKGRTLRHVAVVRKLTLIGRSKANEAFTAATTVPLTNEWKRPDLRVIVFAQSGKSDAILSLSELPVQ